MAEIKCRHTLTSCNDCEGNGCSYCDGRGYYEICRLCHAPMGSLRRKWKRAGRPMPWVGFTPPPPESRKKIQRKHLPTLEVLFCMWAWHYEVKLTSPPLAEGETKTIDLDREFPPTVDRVMAYLYGAPEKVIYAKLEQLDGLGLIECGVSLRTGWPTEKGMALLREAGLVDSA